MMSSPPPEIPAGDVAFAHDRPDEPWYAEKNDTQEETMLHIGCHLSSSKGFAAMGRQALELGADTFQFFTRNPRGSKAKDLDSADAAALAGALEKHHTNGSDIACAVAALK